MALQKKPIRQQETAAWLRDQQRRDFVEHLRCWSSDHDSSVYFHGAISVVPHVPGAEMKLGMPVRCIITDDAWTDARRKIVIRLFPPCGRSSTYRMVVLSGSGWMSSRDYLSREHFARQHARTSKVRLDRLDRSLRMRSERMLGSRGADRDSVSISPLFHPFPRLPVELQQSILGEAVGKQRACWPNRESPAVARNSRGRSPTTSLGTLFRVSKTMVCMHFIIPPVERLESFMPDDAEQNEHLVPWIYRTSDFHFGHVGFTNFLWQSGPARRRLIRRLTFEWGGLALLHCVRWLAPDPILNLFQPRVDTDPRGLQYVWRKQIQELSLELHLHTVALDVGGVPPADLVLVARILLSVFGSIDRLVFVGCDGGATAAETRSALGNKTWTGLCCAWFESRRDEPLYYSPGRQSSDVEVLKRAMEDEHSFFDQALDPALCEKIMQG